MAKNERYGSAKLNIRIVPRRGRGGEYGLGRAHSHICIVAGRGRRASIEFAGSLDECREWTRCRLGMTKANWSKLIADLADDLPTIADITGVPATVAINDD